MGPVWAAITSPASFATAVVLTCGWAPGGFHRYDAAGDRFDRFQFRNQTGSHISVDDIRCLMQDRSNLLWVGTNLGLNKHIPLKDGFTHRYRIPGQTDPNALFHNVHSFAQDRRGGIWVGGRGMGVARLGGGAGPAVYLTHRGNEQNSLSSNEVRKVFVDAQETLWVGTYGSGLNRVRFAGGDLTKPSVRRYRQQQGDIFGDVIHDLLEDHSGQLWVGTRSGLGLYDPLADRIVRPGDRILGFHALDNAGVYTFLEDREKRLWIGTLGDGIYRLDPGGPAGRYQFVRYRVSPQVGLGPACNQILSLHQDRDGAIWAGTLTGGLSRLDPRTERFTYLTEKNGLSSNMVYGILEDENQDLWLSTSHGLCWFRRRTGDFLTFTEADGLPSDDYNGGAYLRTPEGEFFFGGGIGFISFFPSRIQPSGREAPRVVLTDLSIMNHPVPIGPLPDGRVLLDRAVDRTQKIELNRRDALLTIGFCALDFANPAKHRYAYRMAGLDPDWNLAQDRRSVTYTYLPPGDFTFMVKSSRGDGTWGSEHTALRVVMKPDLWETRWFRWGLVALLLSLGLAAYQLRIWTLRKRKLVLERVVRERTRELKQANETLSRVNQELEMLSMAASETDNAIAIHDAEGRIEWVNQGFVRLFGWNLEGVVARFGANLRTQSFSCQIDEYVDTCLREKRSVVYEVLNETRNRGSVWTQTTMTPILNAAGEVVKMVTVETDISKIKEAEAAAGRANRAKSAFLARMSHEIRTPLNGIMGFAELLGDFKLSDVQHEYLEVIQRSGGILLELINDILDLSKIEAGEMKLEFMPFDPELVAYEVCDLMLPKVKAGDLEILCDVGNRVPALITGDPVRFRQVLINLMGNAVKFTSRGEVALSVQVIEKDERKIKLLCTVTDSGIGLDPAKREIIFNEFQQAEESTTRQFGGSGLGLSIARRIARLMGGDVWADARPDGQPGSQFLFDAWFSLAEQPALPEARPAFSVPMGKKILVVDDNPRNLTIVQRMLGALPEHVTLCQHSAEVMGLVEKEFRTHAPFDLIILDIDMPDPGGIELARSIRCLDGPAGRVPLLAFSSTTQQGMAYFKDQGFNGYLTKPIRQDRLLAMIRRMLGEDGVEKSDLPGPFLTSEFLAEGCKQSTRILVVEDNPINLKLIRYMLERAGYQFVLAEDGYRALQLLELDDRGFDIIFMDVQMPGIDGCETTRRIRAQGIETPVVAMTAASMPRDRENCLQAGMNEYLAKPIKRSDVYEMIKRFCLGRH
jgi:PAS domain S-box-containing protein